MIVLSQYVYIKEDCCIFSVVVQDRDGNVVINETRPKERDEDFDETFGSLEPFTDYIIATHKNGTEGSPRIEEFRTGRIGACIFLANCL